MNRLQRAGLGLSLMALVGVGAVNGGNVFAQDATPTPNTSTTTEATTPEETERNAFLDAFAAQLGVTDEAQIDAAILGAFQQILAEKVAAGDITQAQADEILARIEAGDVRFGGGILGGKHGHGGDFDADRDNRGSNNGADDDEDSTTPAVEATPAANTGIFA